MEESCDNINDIMISLRDAVHSFEHKPKIVNITEELLDKFSDKQITDLLTLKNVYGWSVQYYIV